jgi:hypothetical protein
MVELHVNNKFTRNKLYQALNVEEHVDVYHKQV